MTHHRCRHCQTPLEQEVIDLGHQPPSNAYLTAQQLAEPEITYPLKVYVCTNCWLVQLPAHAAAEELFTPDYAYFSSTSSSWCAHAERYVTTTSERLGLGADSLVVELASNDGYLLQYVLARGIPCLGIDPTTAASAVARQKGIATIERFFGLALAEELVEEGRRADLIVANNVLAHVPDINDFLAGMTVLLKPTGQVSVEFPHLLSLLQGNQFDTIYHEHYSYISLGVLQRIANHAGLMIVDVEKLNTHGGSLRVWMAARQGDVVSGPAASERIKAILQEEADAELNSLKAYAGFQQRAELAKHNLLRFLLDVRQRGERVLGYGAAAKGNTLLNYAGVSDDLLPFVADKAPSKIGRFLPGSHIPVISPEEWLSLSPHHVLVLPWNLAKEVKAMFADRPGLLFHRAIPKLETI
ncbi:class I SAM-dependent methyltransferase [Cyanobium sp. NIES-981]|uniref:class I SAM-dependent methyltransferase n=1 Tax=Cyanobium sp. NIES-981 TaxID=1851505 RepID=UPI0007DDB2EA|nr:class I SAM-dependent methyltransferase [Cyanobium sp. NIES-981]SBO44568.1 Methyltransferase [Cyanobium sp. NIES-981]